MDRHDHAPTAVRAAFEDSEARFRLDPAQSEADDAAWEASVERTDLLRRYGGIPSVVSMTADAATAGGLAASARLWHARIVLRVLAEPNGAEDLWGDQIAAALVRSGIPERQQGAAEVAVRAFMRQLRMRGFLGILTSDADAGKRLREVDERGWYALGRRLEDGVILPDPMEPAVPGEF